MKKRFGTFFTKITGFIFIVLFVAVVSVVALNFFAPTPVTNAPGSNPASQSQPIANNPTPSPTQTLAPNPSDTPASQASPNSENTNTTAPTNAEAPAPTATSNSNSPALSALAQPDQVTLVAPKKLAPGAVQKKYENIDNNPRPDPINYSPVSSREVAGLTLTSVGQSQFQEVSGYFLAERTGNYAFVVTYPDTANLDASNLRLRIDGQPLANVKGGTVNLEKGWHKVDLFYFEQYGGNAANSIQVKWGLEGSDLKRMQVWREVL